jgi:hypothetical protein
VAGCTQLLCAEATPRYRLRYRLCETHLRADAVLVRGVAMRFCQARRRASGRVGGAPYKPATYKAPSALS